MKRKPKHRRRQSAFERIEAALEQNTESSNVEKIRLMRELYFADVDALQKSGTIKLPKYP